MEKECFNCKNYLYFDGGRLEICLLHKVRIYAEDGKACKWWKQNDDLHDNSTVERAVKEIIENIPTQE